MILLFCVVWFWFRLLRRYLALWPMEVGRVYRLLEMVREGCPGHGPMVLSIFSLLVLLRWVSDGILLIWVGLDLVYLCLAIWLALFSISRLLFLMLGITRLQLIFAAGRVFDVGLCWMSLAPCSSLILLLFEKEIRLCFVAPWLGGVWNGLLLGRVRSPVVPCRFCGAPDGDGHLFWECTLPPLVEIRENPEFHDLMRMDKEHWPRCLLWHGWLPVLSGVPGASPWAADASETRMTVFCVRRRLRQWLCWAGFAGISSRCSPCCRLQAPDAPHHGRYVPKGQLCVLSRQWRARVDPRH